MALNRGWSIPIAARDAFVIVEMECTPTISELDAMPERLVDTILLYKEVKNVIMYGGRLQI